MNLQQCCQICYRTFLNLSANFQTVEIHLSYNANMCLILTHYFNVTIILSLVYTVIVNHTQHSLAFSNSFDTQKSCKFTSKFWNSGSVSNFHLYPKICDTSFSTDLQDLLFIFNQEQNSSDHSGLIGQSHFLITASQRTCNHFRLRLVQAIKRTVLVDIFSVIIRVDKYLQDLVSKTRFSSFLSAKDLGM